MKRSKIIELKNKYNLSQLECDLIQMEGLRLKPYKCTSGKWTIGVGHNLEDNPLDRYQAIHLLFLRDDQIKERESFFIDLLRSDISAIGKNLKECAFSYKSGLHLLDDVRRFVIINMCFQIGIIGLSKFVETLKAIKAFNYDLAAKEMLDSKWARQTPTHAKLLAERMRTGKIEEGGIYE